MERVIKALSLWQPWASAIAVGAKRIETRHWKTDYRGPLLIHAAKWHPGKKDADDIEELAESIDLRFWDLPFGAIVAVARLVDCPRILSDVDGKAYLRSDEWYNDELALGDFSPGRYGWVLDTVRALPQPIPYKGAQGLFNVPVDVLPKEFRP